MGQLPFCKIIVDSRHADAGTSSSFEISLPETLSLPHNAVAYVCDSQVTHTCASTNKTKNTFYWIEQALGQNSLNRVFLANKSYTPETLATEIQTRMNESSIFRPTPGYVVTFEEDLGAIKITRPSLPDKTFILANDYLLQQLFSNNVLFQTYDDNNGIQPWTMNYTSPKSAMSLLGLGPRSSENITLFDLLSLGNDLGNTHFTGALNLRANHCIYLHSPNLTNYKVLGPASSRSCIARVAVNSGYGSILTHQHSGHPLDYVPCGGVTLRTLLFEIRNANIEVVEMRGGHVSFSIISNSTHLVSNISWLV